MSSVKQQKKTKLDIFDFDKYPKEHRVFKYFYSDLELHLRFAIFISYKYGHLSKENRSILNLSISKKTGVPLKIYKKNGCLKGTPIDKEYLDMLTDTFEPYYLVKYWYFHYNPEKYSDKNKIYKMLERYRLYEDVIFNKIYKLYVDPDWQYSCLWFSKSSRITRKGQRQKMRDYYKELNERS